MKERITKIVLIVVGLLFTAGIYPLVTGLRDAKTSEIEPMMLSLYVTLGIFLLLAARNPSGSRTVIQYAAWSSFAHAATMAVQAIQATNARNEFLAAVALFAVIGVLLVAVVPAKQVTARASTA